MVVRIDTDIFANFPKILALSFRRTLPRPTGVKLAG